MAGQLVQYQTKITDIRPRFKLDFIYHASSSTFVVLVALLL